MVNQLPDLVVAIIGRNYDILARLSKKSLTAQKSAPTPSFPIVIIPSYGILLP